MKNRRLSCGVLAIIAAAIIAIGEPRAARAGSIFDDNYKPSDRPEPQKSSRPAPDHSVAPTPQPAAPETPPAAPRIRPTAVGPAKPVRYPMAVPSEPSCQEAEKLVRDVYKDEFSRKTAADKATLGLHLLGEAREEADDAVTRYVLYREAIDACGAGRDVMHALQGVDEMGWIFAVDRFGMALNQFSAAGSDPATTPSIAHQAANAALSLAAEAVAAGRYAEAAKIASAAQSLARKSHDPALMAWASAWSDQTHEIEEKSREISSPAAKLKSAPDDPAAYGELGAFYCFWCGFWEKGLPMLAKGSDAELKSIAAKDRVGAEADGAAQSGLADQWMSLSDKQTGVAKDAMQRRACKWYRTALPQLTGLTKLTAEKRIGQIVAPQFQHGLTAEIFRSQILVGQVRTRVDPSIDFNWDSTPPDPMVRHEHYSVRWTGWLKAPSPGIYKIIALSDDGIRIWIDGNEVINHWGQGPLSETATVTLGADPAELCIEYYQDRGQAHMGLGWVIPGANRPRAIPASALYHEPIEFARMFKPPLKAESDGVIHLNPDSADIRGPNLREAAEANPVDCLGDWFAMEDSASWKFTAAPGDYDVQLGFAAGGECNGAAYVMTVNGATLSGTISDSGGWFNWAQQDVGRLHLGGGNQTLSIKATSMPRDRIMNIQTITLTPVKQE